MADRERSKHREDPEEMQRKAREVMERDREFVEQTQPPLQGSEETATRVPACSQRA